MLGGALKDEDAGDAGAHEQHARGGTQQGQGPTTPADLHPAGPSGIVRLAPDQGDTRADQHGRPQIYLGGAAEIDLADEGHGDNDHGEQSDDLPTVRLAGHEPAAAVAHGLREGGRPVGVDAADAQRHEEPERRVQQPTESVRHDQADEHDPHPDHGQSEMPGEPSRHAPEPASVTAAVELARGPRVLCGYRHGFRHASMVTCRGDSDIRVGPLGSFVWIRLDQGAGSGACSCKAEEEVDAERRRLTTTRLGVPPTP